MLVLCQKNYNTGATPPKSQPNIHGESRGKWPCQGTRPEVSQDRGAGEPLRKHIIKKYSHESAPTLDHFSNPSAKPGSLPNIDRSQTRPTLSECRLAPPHPSSRKEMRRTNTHTHTKKQSKKSSPCKARKSPPSHPSYLIDVGRIVIPAELPPQHDDRLATTNGPDDTAERDGKTEKTRAKPHWLGYQANRRSKETSDRVFCTHPSEARHRWQETERWRNWRDL